MNSSNKNSDLSNSRVWFLTLAIVSLGVLLRFLLLGKESLWYDEAFSVNLALQDLPTVLAAEVYNPPFYFTVLHFWLKLSGASEAALRFPSAIFGSISLLLIFLLTRKCFGQKVALFTLLWAALSPFHIYYAQEARCYTLLLCLQLCSVWFLLRSFETKGSYKSLAAYGFFTLAALYTHFTTVFFVIAQNICALRGFDLKAKLLLRWSMVQLLVILGFFPWLLTMFEAASRGDQNRQHFFLKPFQALFSFLVGDTLIPLDGRAVKDVFGTIWEYRVVFSISTLAFGLLLLITLFGLRYREKVVQYFIVLFCLPIIIVFLISFKLMIFDERYFFALTPYLYALCISVLFSSRIAWFKGILLSLSGAMMMLSLYNYYFQPRFGKDQWREAVQYVEERIKPDDFLLIHPYHSGLCWDYYAKDKEKRRLVRIEEALFESKSWSKLKREFSDSKRVWLVHSLAGRPGFVEWFTKRYAAQGVLKFQKDKGINVWLFEGRARAAVSKK